MENFSKTSKMALICNYEDFETISVVKKGVYTTSLVQDPFSGARYVKKELSKEKLPIYQKLQKLKHQGLAEVVEFLEKDDKIIVIIEYAVGKTLKSILDSKIKLDEKVAINYIQQLTSILNVVHQNGIIHRDINPSNIIVATNGQVKLIDFDIARFYKYSQTEDTQLLGTPGYAAPEQFGFNQSTASSDIYALGVLLNVMITGMKPNEMQVSTKGLALIVKNCTAMDQSLRYQDVMQLDYDLRRLRHTVTNDFPKKPSKKTTIFSKVSIILGFLLLGSVGYIIFQALQTPQEPTVQLQNIDEPQTNLFDQEPEQVTTILNNSQIVDENENDDEKDKDPEIIEAEGYLDTSGFAVDTNGFFDEDGIYHIRVQRGWDDNRERRDDTIIDIDQDLEIWVQEHEDPRRDEVRLFVTNNTSYTLMAVRLRGYIGIEGDEAHEFNIWQSATRNGYLLYPGATASERLPSTQLRSVNMPEEVQTLQYFIISEVEVMVATNNFTQQFSLEYLVDYDMYLQNSHLFRISDTMQEAWRNRIPS